MSKVDLTHDKIMDSNKKDIYQFLKDKFHNDLFIFNNNRFPVITSDSDLRYECCCCGENILSKNLVIQTTDICDSCLNNMGLEKFQWFFPYQDSIKGLSLIESDELLKPKKIESNFNDWFVRGML